MTKRVPLTAQPLLKRRNWISKGWKTNNNWNGNEFQTQNEHTHTHTSKGSKREGNTSFDQHTGSRALDSCRCIDKRLLSSSTILGFVWHYLRDHKSNDKLCTQMIKRHSFYKKIQKIKRQWNTKHPVGPWHEFTSFNSQKQERNKLRSVWRN